jgi:exopolysaccharide biosynthesis protein
MSKERSQTGALVLLAVLALVMLAPSAPGAVTTSNPYSGVTYIRRTEASPRTLSMNIVQIDLNAPGLSFKLSPQGVGTPHGRETFRQTTLNYLNQEHAQVAVNTHFFLPFPSSDTDADLIGLGASNGNVYSAFEDPVQSYAIVNNAPGLNIEPDNDASIVTANLSDPNRKQVNENVTVWNAVAGSAQIVTNGLTTIPEYVDASHPNGLLTPGGPASYSNSNSWYNLPRGRTAIGLSQDANTLTIFTVDQAGGSGGMTGGEVADLLRNDYGVFNALNLDGGGSTTLAMLDPVSGVGQIKNLSADGPLGRAVAANLAIFAAPVPEPIGGTCLLAVLTLAGMARLRARNPKA